mmetsp:Transcript_13563/g.37473  ORF Transcript_13563/g.37473 Transcript_13563/m.37473 type:complete len:136 (-) Transcript_13563:2637-3044(-)
MSHVYNGFCHLLARPRLISLGALDFRLWRILADCHDAHHDISSLVSQLCDILETIIHSKASKSLDSTYKQRIATTVMRLFPPLAAPQKLAKQARITRTSHWRYGVRIIQQQTMGSMRGAGLYTEPVTGEMQESME